MTRAVRARTMRPMDRSTLEHILNAADGISTDGSTSKDGGTGYIVEETHRVTFYIGEGGQATAAMAIAEVASCALYETYATITARAGATTYVPAGSVLAISVKPPKGDDRRRAGFS